MNNNFWNNKKVLITGHTGFKGTWLSFWLNRMGASVKGIALKPATLPNMYDYVIRENDVESTYGDIRDLTFLKTEAERFNPEIIIHLAAQPLVRKSYKNPVETFQTNILGTVNILEVVKSVDNVRAVLCVTSDKCYENREWVWQYRESDTLGGWDPYSASKGCAELIVSSYEKSYFNTQLYDKHGVAVASARAGNVIGGGDWAADRLIPDIVRSFTNEQPVFIRNPHAIRPWQHVLDLLRGYIMLAEKLYEKGPSFTGAWNFGPTAENEITVHNLVESITQMWGNQACWKHDEQDSPHEAFTLKLDSSKARKYLDWEPILSLDRSLKLVVDWYKKFYTDAHEARAVTEKQIAFFERQINSRKFDVLMNNHG